MAGCSAPSRPCAPRCLNWAAANANRDSKEASKCLSGLLVMENFTSARYSRNPQRPGGLSARLEGGQMSCSTLQCQFPTATRRQPLMVADQGTQTTSDALLGFKFFPQLDRRIKPKKLCKIDLRRQNGHRDYMVVWHGPVFGVSFC